MGNVLRNVPRVDRRGSWGGFWGTRAQEVCDFLMLMWRSFSLIFGEQFGFPMGFFRGFGLLRGQKGERVIGRHDKKEGE